MFAHNGLWPTTAAALFVLAVAPPAEAARARFHYVPADPAGHVTLKPGACPGERVTVFGKYCDACPPRPNCYQTFCHPCTGQTVIVPLALPFGTPTIYHRPNRVVYNYGSDFVEVHFLPDGSVDVIYSSGLFRAI